MIYIVYNDFKEADILANLDKFKGNDFIVNNCQPSKETIERLKIHCGKVYYCLKLYQGLDDIVYAREAGYDHIAVDAENYTKDMKYDFIFGAVVRSVVEPFESYILLPENLGGDKYEGYDDFILSLSPDAILMERSYLSWKPWELLKFYNRNKWWGKVYIGVWQDRLWPVFKQIQMFFAKWISGNKIFFYTEKKLMP